jgi:glycosyltransferase involved in cell wall biosynthesis
MRILLSAYACEPYRGSEPGVGWNWASELQRHGNSLVVLTRTSLRPKIEQFFSANPTAPRPEFVYYELPAPLLYLFRKGWLPEQIYYVIWQMFCVPTARQAAQDHKSELVWHVTLGTIRLPCFLWRLGKPFVYGPAGGGERTPFNMRTDYSLYAHAKDNLRDALNWLSRIDPMMRAVFAKADLILARTPESAQFVSRRLRDKVRIVHEVGVVQVAPADAVRTSLRRVLYVGNFRYWKGVRIAMRAFGEFIRLGGVGRFTMVGQGPEEPMLRQLAKDANVDHLIDWIPWMEQRHLWRIYDEHDVFLFPSLHDSGGTVVVEALSRGLPVVCIDLGGPGQIVNNDAGFVQPTAGRTAPEVSVELGRVLKRLFDDPAEFKRLSAGALAHAEDFRWSARAARALREIQQARIV